MSKQLIGLERSFLESWEDWDEVDTFAMQFSGIVLLPEYTHIMADLVFIDGEKSLVEFYKDGEVTASFKVKLVKEEN